MSDDEIARLIARLQELQTRQQEILAEELQITQRIQEATTRVNSSQDTPDTSGRVSPDPGVFTIGQHVFIQNRITHVQRFRRPNLADRAAVVQRLTRDRIYVRTYNGHDTWRSPTNLRHLSIDERTEIRPTRR